MLADAMNSLGVVGKWMLWGMRIVGGGVVLLAVTLIGFYFFKLDRMRKEADAKLLELKAMPSEQSETLAAICDELLRSGKQGDIAREDWPPLIEELSPLFVRVEEGENVLLYFSGGFFPFIYVYWRPDMTDEGISVYKLQLLYGGEDDLGEDDGCLDLWPRES